VDFVFSRFYPSVGDKRKHDGPFGGKFKGKKFVSVRKTQKPDIFKSTGDIN